MAAKAHSEIRTTHHGWWGRRIRPGPSANSPCTACLQPQQTAEPTTRPQGPSAACLREGPPLEPSTTQPGVSLSTAHRAWGRRGPVSQPRPDQNRVPQSFSAHSATCPGSYRNRGQVQETQEQDGTTCSMVFFYRTHDPRPLAIASRSFAAWFAHGLSSFFW